MNPFQVAFNAKVPKRGEVDGTRVEIGPETAEMTSGYTWYTTGRLPYKVPKGWYLGITDAHFGSKYVNFEGKTRSSYLVLENIFTLTEVEPSVSLRRPFIVPPGQTLRAAFWNNSTEEQWMNGFVLGLLSRDPMF